MLGRPVTGGAGRCQGGEEDVVQDKDMLFN